MSDSPMGDAPPPVGACRVCGELSWRADDAGAVHLCCARWEAAGAIGTCPACAQSRENARAQRQRRRPVLLPWPRHGVAEPPAPAEPIARTPAAETSTTHKEERHDR